MADGQIVWDTPAPARRKDDIVWDEPPKEMSTGDQFKRALGLTGRAAANVLTSPIQVGGDMLNKAVNALGGNLPMASDVIGRQLDRVFPKPQGFIENMGQEMAKGAPAALLPQSLLAQTGGNAAVAAALAKPGQEATEGGIAAAIPVGVRAAGWALPKVLGAFTGTGGRPIEEAYKAGAAGGKASTDFTGNMRGRISGEQLVDDARGGLQAMRDTMSRNYQANKSGWAGGNQVMNFAPIERAYQDLVASTQYAGATKLAPADQRILTQINTVLDEWRANPALRTVEGMDTLKQRIRNIYPESPEHTQSRRLIETMANKVKDEIVARAPGYGAAMQDYAGRLRDIDEVSKSLSLGDKASIDTALRKLTSSMRNNVNTNFGQRERSMEKLATEGLRDVMPGAAGQAMNSWSPRGLQGAVAPLGFTGLALANPLSLLGVPASIPRLVGEGAHAAGRAAKYTPDMASMIAAALRAGEER